MLNSERIAALISAKLTERATAQAALSELRAKPDAEVTVEQITEATTARDAFDGEIDILVEDRTSALRDEARQKALDELAREFTPRAPAGTPGVLPGTGTTVRVGQEPRQYSEERNMVEGVSFFADAYRAQKLQHEGAKQRLERHATEVRVAQQEYKVRTGKETRASATGSYAGLVVPQYLTDMVAPLLRAGRATANICTHHELPSQGMQLIIPRGTTGASAAIQASENTAVSSTDEVLANLTVPVVTISGQQDVSRQSLERGEMIDTFVYGDLARAYAAALGNQVINGSGTAGQMLGVLNTSGISAATAYGAVITAGSYGLKIAGQITAVTSTGAGLVPNVIIMSPRRWGWLLGQADSTGRPIVTAYDIAQFNAMAQITAPGEISADAGGPTNVNQYAFVGKHNSGLPVLTDLNIPVTVGTNSEDVSLVAATAEYHLWEEGNGAPNQLEFEQTTGGSLTTKLVVYNYSAFTAGRYPSATGKTGGVDTTATFGQVAPAF